MTVLLISYEFPPYTDTGGIATYSLNTVSLWIKHGINVIVFSANPRSDQLRLDLSNGYPHYIIPASNEVAFRKLATELFSQLKDKYNFSFIECPETGAAALDIKEIYPDIPLLVRLHSPGVLISKISKTYDPLYDKLKFIFASLLKGQFNLGFWSTHDKKKDVNLEYKICCKAEKLFSPSLALKNWICKYWDLPHSKIEVVPNPFSSTNRYLEITHSKKKKLICFVGKLSILKGVNSMARALEIILERNRDYKVKIVGRNDLDLTKNEKSINSIYNKIKKFGNRVEFTGVLEKDELFRVYEEAAISIVPSLWENYPSVILESMSSLSCLVASNVGGIPEIISDKQDGLLFSPKSYRQLAKKIQSIIDNEELKECLIQSARNKITDIITSDMHEKSIIDSYRSFHKSNQKTYFH
jgi:glycosyltransferase involved in cell wall biosynthesis